MVECYQIKKVMVIGAGGNLNPLIIATLQSFGFVVSVLVRASSAVEQPPGTQMHRTDYSHSSLLEAFRGQDAVINTITMPVFSEQKIIIDAAIEVGVKRYLPGEFGIDTSKKATVNIVPFLKAKPEVVEYLRSHESKISWTAFITGPFFDWGLRNGFFSFNLASRLAYIHHPGYHEQKFSCTTLSTVANAVAHSLLKNDSVVTNRYVYIRSFTANQGEILQSLCCATEAMDKNQGRNPQPWRVIDINLEEKAIEAQQQLALGDTSGLGYLLSKAIYRTGGNFDSEGLVMNEELGIDSQEDLHAVVKRAVVELSN